MPWRPQSDETRRAKDEAVVTAAAALFVERGFAGTTMAEIAEAAGVSRALLYARYGDAVEILVCTALDLLVAPRVPR